MSQLELEFSEEEFARLTRLQAQCSDMPLTDVFNNALSLLKWAVDQRRAGRTVASIDEASDNYREFLSPELANVRPAAPSETPVG